MQPLAPEQDSRGFTSETKFIVDAAVGVQIRDWARSRLAPDPHGGGTFSDEYPVASLYLDTKVLDVFHRRGSYGRSKYRIRRYDEEQTAFLERKLRTAARLSKRRSRIELAALTLLATGAAPAPVAVSWFQRRVAIRGLRPVCQVSYVRTARVANTPEGPARLTLDRAVAGVATDSFRFEGAPGTPVLEGRMILELKHRGHMPAVFRQLVDAFALNPRRSSKYRAAAEVLGLVGIHA